MMIKKRNCIIGVDHIGYAVKDMDRAKASFGILGFEFSETRVDELRKVNVTMGSRDGVKVELLAPLDGVKSPVDGYLQKLGSTPYHICYQVEDMTTAIDDLRERGFTQLGYPAPSFPLGGNVCFLYSGEIGIIELIEYPSDNAG